MALASDGKLFAIVYCFLKVHMNATHLCLKSNRALGSGYFIYG